ncbi:unnamed protein product [Prorocentrum cordatum]|uniref:Uncharacterized protein n=1 Tax=Prorocentrum cordatum TaxID=2364126 RepID=A0ABN9TLJ4_9DINO|nr:unnamed protein product [Polarella glacialis]
MVVAAERGGGGQRADAGGDRGGAGPPPCQESRWDVLQDLRQDAQDLPLPLVGAAAAAQPRQPRAPFLAAAGASSEGGPSRRAGHRAKGFACCALQRGGSSQRTARAFRGCALMDRVQVEGGVRGWWF